MTKQEVYLRRLHCALYTWKSSEEGLEQEFNSLHAQREACEAWRGDLAEPEGIASSYMTRVLRLTLLPPASSKQSWTGSSTRR